MFEFCLKYFFLFDRFVFVKVVFRRGALGGERTVCSLGPLCLDFPAVFIKISELGHNSFNKATIVLLVYQAKQVSFNF